MQTVCSDADRVQPTDVRSQHNVRGRRPRDGEPGAGGRAAAGAAAAAGARARAPRQAARHGAPPAAQAARLQPRRYRPLTLFVVFSTGGVRFYLVQSDPIPWAYDVMPRLTK